MSCPCFTCFAIIQKSGIGSGRVFLILIKLSGDVLAVRYCFIDSVKECTKGASITVSKAVSYGEPFLEDHFPGAPVLPGAMMIEGAIEAALWLMRSTAEFAVLDWDLVSVKQGKFSRVVAPGDVLITTVEVDKKHSDEDTTWFRANGKCEEAKAFSVRFALKSAIIELLSGNKEYLNMVSQRQKELWTILNTSLGSVHRF
jgi:3-hydroxyacyl-[acyl-carrier-protein] dehydratase